MKASGASHPGRVREQNEDAFLVEPELGLFVVADGMGGHKAGEVASALALDAIHAFILRASKDDDHTWPFGLERSLDGAGNRLRTALKLANRQVFKESERRDRYTGMGTTVAAVLAGPGSLTVCGVGDSRVYSVRGDAIDRLTTDDTWIETLLAQTPGLDRASLASHPMRHVLTSVVGAQDDVEVTVTAHGTHANERLVLCTDGIHDALPDGRIADIVRVNADVAAAADALVQAALAADGGDNLTAIVVDLES
jgi:protein phosphatase